MQKIQERFSGCIKRYQNTINKLKGERTQLDLIKTQFDQYVGSGFCLLENVQCYYVNATVDVQQI